MNNFVVRFRCKLNSLLARLRLSMQPSKAVPVYPKITSPGLRVHLGSGPINLQGWVNVDARPASHVHLTVDGFDLDEFADGGLSEIYMCHVLEHFSFHESKSVLEKLCNKLKQGGVLRLSVPDFDKLVDVYMANSRNLGTVDQALMGGQDYEHNFHKSLYTHDFLKNLLESCGFTDVVAWASKEDFGVDLGDWSEKKYVTPATATHISLNLKARKA